MERKIVDGAYMRAEIRGLRWRDRLRLLFGAVIVVRVELDSFAPLDVGGHRIHVDIVPRTPNGETLVATEKEAS